MGRRRQRTTTATVTKRRDLGFGDRSASEDEGSSSSSASSSPLPAVAPTERTERPSAASPAPAPRPAPRAPRARGPDGRPLPRAPRSRARVVVDDSDRFATGEEEGERTPSIGGLIASVTNAQESSGNLAVATWEMSVMVGDNLEGRDKREWMEARLSKLGARKPANPKIPVKIFNGMRKKRKERAVKERELLRQTGMAQKTVKLRGKGHRAEDYKRLKRSSNMHDSGARGLKASIGRFRGGTLYLSQRDYESIEGPRRSSQSAVSGSKRKRAPPTSSRKQGKGKRSSKRRRR